MNGQVYGCWTNVWFACPNGLKIFAPLSSWCRDKFYQVFRKKRKKTESSIKIPPKDHLCLGLLPALGPAPVTVAASNILNREGLKTAPSIHEAHSSSYLRLKFTSRKGRLAQNIYILVGGRTNSPFPAGALKVAVDLREADGGGGKSLWYSKAPTSTSQTAQVHSPLGKSSNSVAPVPLWQP